MIGLFAAPGIYLIVESLKAVPDAVDLFGYFDDSFAFVLLMLLFIIAALGTALLIVAWMLYRADRVGRGLAYVIVAMFVTAVLFGDSDSTGLTLSLLAAIAAAAVLAFAPAVRDFFRGPHAPQRDQPTSIVVARVSVAIWIALLAIDGIMLLMLGGIEGKYIAIGILLLGVGAGALVLYQRLAAADRQARLITTIAAGVAVVLLLIGRDDNGFVMLVGLTVAIPICLWLPPDARIFYGDKPIEISTSQ